MKSEYRIPLTRLEACTLMARETVSLLEGFDEVPDSAIELLDALAMISTAQDLGDGGALLAWVNAEMENTKRLAKTGEPSPSLVKLDTPLPIPDPDMQLEAVCVLLQAAAARRPCTMEQWETMLGAVRILTEVDGLEDMVLGCEGKKNAVTALVDSDDIHCLMIGASGVGKTAFFLYPNLEYACASGMSFLAFDTKGDLARNYGAIASKHYSYKVAVIDLRNPTRSDGYNLLTLINHYMDVSREDPGNLSARAKAEKYAKILAKTIVNPEGDVSSYGQNVFFVRP